MASPFFYLDHANGELQFSYEVRTPRPAPKKRVIVVGGSVTGYTTAWALLDAGYAVTMLSEQWAPATPRVTGQVAGALWEYPPAVCGRHTDECSLNYSKGWAMTTFRVFSDIIASAPASVHGLRNNTANFFFDRPVEKIPEEHHKMLELIKLNIRNFRRDANIVNELAVNPRSGAVDAYSHDAPAIDTDAYLLFLRNLVLHKGASLITTRINGDLLAQEDQLLAKYDATAIVNASGLASWELAADSTVYPLRGALIRVINDGKKFPKVTQSYAVTHNAELNQDIVFIVPRNDNIMILGGLAQPNKWELDLTLDSPEIKAMRARCNAFVPGLENADYDPTGPLVQGLRPFRQENVRVERELRRHADGRPSRIVHSYGHGGAGFALSMGCAGDVLKLVQQVEKGDKAKAMTEVEVRAML